MSISIKDNNYFREFGSAATDWEKVNLKGLIYRIVNLVNGKSYIGQTINWFNQRYRGGAWWRQTDNKPLEKAAIKYGINNFEIQIWEYNISTIEELNKLETMYILLFNTFIDNDEGYDMDLGGNNRNCSKETRVKISKANSGKNHHFWGKKRSKESKERMSKAQLGEKNHNFGKKASQETRHKLSIAHKGRKQSLDHIVKRTSARKRPIQQMDKNTDSLIKIWPSAMDAGKELSIKRQDITANCKGRQKSAHGFKWAYVL